MKIVIACLLLAVAFATRETVQPSIINGGLTLAEVQQIEELRNTKWGSIFITMAELQSQVGPMERLVQALDDLLKELAKSQSDEKNRYHQKKAAHESTVQSLNSQISEAKSEINKNKLLINSVLIPRKSQAEADIGRAEVTILQKKKDIASAKDKRKIEAAEHEARLADHNNAIAATDESLGLVNQLVRGAGTTSLVEIKKATMSIRRLEARVKQTHMTEAPFVEALIALVSSQNFANQDSIQKVLSMLNEFRSKLAKSLDLERANEAAAIKAFNELLVQLNNEITQLNNDIRKNTQVISDTKQAIDNANNLIMVKTHELLELNSKLETENETFRKETVTHKEVMTELHKESNIVQQCKDLFSKAQFGSYVTGKLNK